MDFGKVIRRIRMSRLKSIKDWWMWPVVFGTLLFALMLSPFVACCPDMLYYAVMLTMLFFMIFMLEGII